MEKKLVRKTKQNSHMRGYKFILWKTYFEKGYGITSYMKYLIAFFGLASQNISTTLYLGVGYFFVCIVVGRLWYRYRLVDTEIEIQNQFNPFVHDVRGHIKKQKI